MLSLALRVCVYAIVLILVKNSKKALLDECTSMSKEYVCICSNVIHQMEVLLPFTTVSYVSHCQGHLLLHPLTLQTTYLEFPVLSPLYTPAKHQTCWVDLHAEIMLPFVCLLLYDVQR